MGPPTDLDGLRPWVQGCGFISAGKDGLTGILSLPNEKGLSLLCVPISELKKTMTLLKAPSNETKDVYENLISYRHHKNVRHLASPLYSDNRHIQNHPRQPVNIGTEPSKIK